MRTWKIVAVIGLVVGFAAAVQAENTPNKISANKISANKLSANRLSANKLSANSVIAGEPGEGAAADIVAIELPNGVRFAR